MAPEIRSMTRLHHHFLQIINLLDLALIPLLLPLVEMQEDQVRSLQIIEMWYINNIYY
jgi:hypothetical protein